MRFRVTSLTLELFVQVAPRRDGKRPNELFKFYGAVLEEHALLIRKKKPNRTHVVLVEHSKY